ncbi:MAG: WecB/TagA/CpsF family glycosyltransferase [Anaerolineales bacterium]|nr:WecB/TagA/CpsF family glycosyltransferase [Anaerolineales bacterium]
MYSMIQRENILGVNVSAINMDQALGAIAGWIESRQSQYVCVTPAHGIMECQRNPELRGIFNKSGLTTPDGMSIVWLLKLRGHSHVGRVYGPDLMEAVCQLSLAARAGWRHYFYGSAPGVVEMLVTRLKERFPGLQVVGAHSPPFRPLTDEEDRAIIQEINAADPDIVWVGISTPKQEQWMASHLDQLSAPVLIGVGAAFDFLAGHKSQAPLWIQRSGLEWLFRLVSEPRRLWRRYAEYPYFVWLVIAQMLGFRDFREQ